MSFSPRTPRHVRAGIVLLDPELGNVQRVIALQYNPDSLTRSLQIKGVGGDGADRTEALRLKGPPVETLRLEAEIDATDSLEAGDTSVTTSGLHSQLALLETLVYPTASSLRANHAQAELGTIEIAPMESALTLFVWSKARVLPVRITEFSITEEGFDPGLNPIRAKVNLAMRVLTVDDVSFGARAGSLFMSYLQHKELLAANIGNAAFGALGITGIA